MAKRQTLLLFYLMANKLLCSQTDNTKKHAKKTKTNGILLAFRMLFNIFKRWGGEGQVRKEKEKEIIHFVYTVFNFFSGSSGESGSHDSKCCHMAPFLMIGLLHYSWIYLNN